MSLTKLTSITLPTSEGMEVAPDLVWAARRSEDDDNPGHGEEVSALNHYRTSDSFFAAWQTVSCLMGRDMALRLCTM